jgi:hypothetical protein
MTDLQTQLTEAQARVDAAVAAVRADDSAANQMAVTRAMRNLDRVRREMRAAENNLDINTLW